MQTEYEARFLSIDADAIRGKLSALSAERIKPRGLMRRTVFSNNDIDERGGWLRLRDEGNRTTLTYKQTVSDAPAIDSILEAEIIVSDFLDTRTLLEAMGFKALRYQENYREEWKLDAVTFDLDTWPDLRTFLEIEGPGEDAVSAAAHKLDLDMAEAVFGSVDEVYLTVLQRDILAETTLSFD
jgi:adenylate cyclase class 2